MPPRLLRWVAIVLPILFWVGLLVLGVALDERLLPWQVQLILLVVFSIGAILFSTWIFRIIGQREEESRRRTEQLAALNESALALGKELDLGTVLQKVVDIARELVKAKYGALGIVNKDGKLLDQFITSGISNGERAMIPHPPRGNGLLGVLLSRPSPIRIDNIFTDPRSVGFPPHHPVMHSFLGVPIVSKGKIYGNLYLTDKVSRLSGHEERYLPFTAEDQQILEMFAVQAAIAIENAQLYRQVQQLAVLQERERFGMDLHDGIIQSIYAIGLMLEDTQHRIQEEPGAVSKRISRAIHELNDVISDIRNYILDLRPQRFQGRDLLRGLEELAREIRANSFLNVRINADSLDTAQIAAEKTVEVLLIAQEALTNVRKHARATNVDINLVSEGGYLFLTIADNGIGMPARVVPEQVGNGLRNMRERANTLMGDLWIENADPVGTRVTLRMPIDND